MEPKPNHLLSLLSHLWARAEEVHIESMGSAMPVRATPFRLAVPHVDEAAEFLTSAG